MRVLKKIFKKIGKVLLYIMIFIVVLIIPVTLSMTFHDWRLGTDTVYAAIPKFGSSISIMLILFLICGKIFKHSMKSERVAERVGTMKRKKWLVAIFISVIIAVGVVLDTQWVYYFTLDGIKSCKPFVTKEYTWEDAEWFKLSVDRHENLQVVIYMKDGEKCTYKDEWTSTPFDEKFEEGMYDYLPWLAVELKEAGAAMDITDWDKLMNKLEYEIRQDCAKRIRAEYEKA